MIPLQAVEADLDDKLKASQTKLFLSEDKLSIESGRDIREIPVSKIDSAVVEAGIGINKLVLRMKDGSETEAAYFTNGKEKAFRKLAATINALKETGKMPKATMDHEDREKASKGDTLVWLIGFTSKYRTPLIVGILLSIVVTSFNLVPPYLLKTL